MEKTEHVDFCSLETISTIPAEQLKENPEHYLDEALKCRNTRDILDHFNKKVQENGRSNFAQHYNAKMIQQTKRPRNYFLEKITRYGQY